MSIGQRLNGTLTHPLSEKALEVLRDIDREPRAVYGINPGIRDRLEVEHLVERVSLPSPFKKDEFLRTGKHAPHFKITAAGKAALENNK